LETTHHIKLAAEIVSAFVSNNSLTRGELPTLLEAVHSAIKMLAGRSGAAAVVAEPPVPAVSIRKSITPDYLICLEDGKQFKSLRRHLANLGMTPQQYRAKWGLTSNYPMVAPNYAAQRSALAKNTGLGQLRGKQAAALSAAPKPVSIASPESNQTIEAVAPKALTAAKSKGEPQRKVTEAAPEAPEKRKPGRPRKATA